MGRGFVNIIFYFFERVNIIYFFEGVNIIFVKSLSSTIFTTTKKPKVI